MATYNAITGTTTGREQPGRFKRLMQATAATALLAVITGCKLTIVVPEGGSVVSAEGIQCYAGESCSINVTSANFVDTFTAVAESGYEFKGWRKASQHLCAGATSACKLDTSPAKTNTSLANYLNTSTELFLAPTFERSTDNRYDVAQWRTLVNSLDSYSYRSDSYLYRYIPNSSSCDEGVLSSAAKARFLKSLNMIRRLHHLPETQIDSAYEVEAQKTALVQMANKYLTHTPSTSDRCYSSAASTGSRTSNLTYRSSVGDPATYPIGWVNDNYNIAAMMEAGHRRWALYPHLAYTAYGQAKGFASMKVFGFSRSSQGEMTSDIDFIAMPYKNYPYVLVSKGSYPTPWSISMVPEPGQSSSFNYFGSTSVTVTEASTGRRMTVRSQHRDSRRYGLANFFSWMVDGWEYDTLYNVSVANVKMPSGATRTINYQVKIDYAPLQ